MVGINHSKNQDKLSLLLTDADCSELFHQNNCSEGSHWVSILEAVTVHKLGR